jgi:hypothetical protein
MMKGISKVKAFFTELSSEALRAEADYQDAYWNSLERDNGLEPGPAEEEELLMDKDLDETSECPVQGF